MAGSNEQVVRDFCEAWSRKDADELRHLPLLLADEVAYGTGVWQGVVTQREPGPLLPGFTTWPRRGDG